MTDHAMNDNELRFFRFLFLVAALWNLAGGVMGYFNTAHSFELLYDRELVDPVFAAIYRGACGTTLLYFIGYSIVAYDPLRQTGVVIVGGIGKIGFATHLLGAYLAGHVNANALVVIVGDFAFFASFLVYLWRVARTKTPLV